MAKEKESYSGNFGSRKKRSTFPKGTSSPIEECGKIEFKGEKERSQDFRVDEKTKVDRQDRSSGYLAEKLEAGSGIEFNIIESSTGEKSIQISVSSLSTGDIEIDGNLTVSGDITFQGDLIGDLDYNNLINLPPILNDTTNTVQDISGQMFVGNPESGITSTYNPTTNKVELNVDRFITRYQWLPIVSGGTSGDDVLVSNTSMQDDVSITSFTRIIINSVGTYYAADGPTEKATSVFYFTDPTSTIVRSHGDIKSGDLLYFNGGVIGFDLEDDDELLVIYDFTL